MTEEEFTSLYKELRWLLFRHARDRLGSADAATDVVAETFHIAWEKRDTLRSSGRDASAYVVGIGKIVTLQHIQDRARKPEDAVDVERLHALVGAGPDIADQVTDQHVGKRVFESLSPSDQRVLRLLLDPAVTDQDAAAQLGLTRKTYAVRVHRLRKRLESQWRLNQLEGGGT